jgi:DNA-binding CsgD family transcriptional regulator
METAQPEQNPSLLELQHNGKVTIDLFMTVGAVGMGCFFAWIFTLFASSFYSDVEFVGNAPSLMVHIVLAAAVVVTLFACWRFSNVVLKLRVLLPLFAAVLSLANLWANLILLGGVHLGIFAACASWALTGIGLALFVQLWAEFVVYIPIGRSKLFFSTAAFASAVFMVVMLLLDMGYRKFVVFALPVLSVCALIFLRRYCLSLKNISKVDHKTSTQRSHLKWRSMFSTVTSSCLLGFGLAWLLSFSGAVPWAEPLMIVCIMVVTLLSAVDVVHGCRMGEGLFSHIFLLLAAVGILPMLFLDFTIQAICVGVCVACTFYIVISGNSALGEHTNLFGMAPMQTFAFGRAFSYLGILLGYIAGYIAFWSGLMGSVTLQWVVVILMLLFILESIISKMQNNYPVDENHEAPHVYSVSYPAARGTAVVSGLEGVIAPPPGVPGKTHAPGYYRQKCEIVAQGYGLTKRQQEVLILLAKGHSAESITRELVVSMHTTKAHTYNIYQKLQVHSRQELIDLIESVQVPDQQE